MVNETVIPGNMQRLYATCSNNSVRVASASLRERATTALAMDCKPALDKSSSSLCFLHPVRLTVYLSFQRVHLADYTAGPFVTSVGGTTGKLPKSNEPLPVAASRTTFQSCLPESLLALFFGNSQKSIEAL